MKLKANVPYNDLVLGRLIQKDEEIEVTKKRGEELLAVRTPSNKPIVLLVSEPRKKRVEKSVPVVEVEQAVKTNG